MSAAKTILVTGATGAQGGATVNALLERGHNVIAVTRNPNSDAAKALSAKGVDVRQGDYTDPAAITRAAQEADSAFAVSTSFEVGASAEIDQGKTLVNALHAAGIGHIVFSSVGGADKNTGIAHFDGKYEIEKHLASLSTPSTVLAPVYFMENLLAPWGLPALKQGTFSAGLPADRVLQQVAVKNIGDFAAALIARGEAVFGKRYDFAGDELTNEAAAAQISQAAGRTITYQGFPAEGLREQSADMADMFTWFNDVGYAADIAALHSNFPDVSWLTYADWLTLHDWSILD